MFVKANRIYRMADTGAGSGGDTGGAGGGDTKPWFDGLDPEIKGYVQTRQLDKKSAAEAFVEAVKAHQNAEKFVGAPADKLIRLPDERTTDTAETKQRHAEEWGRIFQRLGVPKEKGEYDFANVKFNDGTELDQAFTDHMREALASARVTKDGASIVTKAVVDFMEKADAAEAADVAAALAEEKKTLQKNWGNNHAANMVVAQNAVKALGIDPTAVNALESVVGYAKVMEMFRTIGSKIGEDRFVTGAGTGGGSNVMTRDQAVAEREALKKDKDWVTRYNNGGTEEHRKMMALNRIITGVTA